MIAELADAGVDFDDVTDTLEREGVDSFAASFKDAFTTIEKRRAEITSDHALTNVLTHVRSVRGPRRQRRSRSASAARRRWSARSSSGTRALSPLVLGIT